MSSNLETEQLYLQYLEMGEDRTLSELAKVTGRSLSSLQKLSYRNGWKKRILLDNKALEQIIDNADLENLSVAEVVSDISRMTLDKLHKSVRQLEPKNMRDARLLLDIHNLISNKPTEIVYTEASTGEGMVSVSYLFEFMESFLSPEQYRDFFDHIGETISRNSI